jgi:protein-tyrosine phosphatase
MIALPYWITSQLAIVPRPHGGPLLNAEMLALREAGIDVVVSMLQQEEASELGLGAEEVSAQKVGLLFINFPIPDAGIPADKLRFNTFLSDLETHLANGRRVGIHCRGCIGRSAVTAAGLMIRSGIPPESAWLQIATARGCPVPGTLEQREWVDRQIRPNSMPAPEFPHSWRVEVLKAPPLIAPARQLTYPRQIAGEEDALARGALQLLVRPAAGGIFLATCALGFTNPAMPTGLFPCPNPDELCAVAGGYAYIIDTLQPEQSTHISLKPVTEVRSLPDNNLILFVGFHTIVAWGPQGQAWESARLSWEGLRITEVRENTLHGTGWNLLTDKEVLFTLDLLTGQHQGGGFSPPPGMQKT